MARRDSPRYDLSGIKKRRKAGSVEDARLAQWRAVSAAQEVLYAAAKEGDVQAVTSAVHALTQATRAYMKTIETDELQEQLDALRAELDALREGARLKKVV